MDIKSNSWVNFILLIYHEIERKSLEKISNSKIIRKTMSKYHEGCLEINEKSKIESYSQKVYT